VIGLSGYAITKIYLTPNPLVFAQQLVGTQAQAGFGIENLSGNQSFTITSITVQGNDFSPVSNYCPSKLQPHYGCGVQIGFTPSATGTRSGTITVVASDSSQSHVAQLQGTGAGAGQVSLSASSLTFGPQTVGTTSIAKNVKLTNTGSGTLNLSSIVTSPSFFSKGGNCGTSLAAGASCTISVKFSPSLAGILMGTLTINDDAIGSPQSVNLSGIGQ
jgi:Abnormal spindle-like microcephaly-assoc'd, ASPM-SPD-2-Hydin/Transmembrane protein 131-like N-terminal